MAIYQCIEHDILNWSLQLSFSSNSDLEFKPRFAYVKWMSLESGRTYTMEDIHALFEVTKVTSSSVSHTHR